MNDANLSIPVAAETATERLSTYPGPVLSDAERDRLVADFERDGFVLMPQLDADLHHACLEAVARLAEAYGPEFKQDNCVDADPALRRLMMWTPAMQLAVDLLGPGVQLNQSNCIRRPASEGARNWVNGAPWHTDGPTPRKFPRVAGMMGLHYVKFGYFLSDLRGGDGGSLQVIRGSHRMAADGKPPLEDPERVVTFDCAPGTVVAFHQALWHAAPLNQSDQPRQNCYYSYSPTWMRPYDRDTITAEEAARLPREEAFLLGAPREWVRWWKPGQEECDALARYARQEEA